MRARVQDGKNAAHNEIGEKNNQECKIDFEARLLVDTDGTVKAEGEKLTVSGASYATVYVFGASNFIDYQTLGDTDIRTEPNNQLELKVGDEIYDLKSSCEFDNCDSYYFIGKYIEFSYGIGVFEKTAVLEVV